MRLPKRHTPLGQVIGQVGGRNQRIAGGVREPSSPPRGAAQHGGRQCETIVHQVDRLKVRRFIFLQVAVVAHR